MTRVLIVTHYLPVDCGGVVSLFEKDEIDVTALRKQIKPKRGHAALYAGMKSLEKTESCHYIGLPGCNLNEKHRSHLDAILEKEFKSYPIYVDQGLHAGHYFTFCKEILWPLLHYTAWDSNKSTQAEKDAFGRYEAVNQRFADKISEIYQPGDMIWIHDYHLLLVPLMVRKAIPMGNIGFFLHVPFPSSEIFRCLPQRTQILEGVLGANMVGFQTYSYARHFVSTCTRVLGVESIPSGIFVNGFFVSIGIFSIGVDVARINKERQSESVRSKSICMREMFGDKKIIIGRDKLDSIKGIHHKLNAFEIFLNTYPEWREKVVLVQVTLPQGDCKALERKVSEQVAEINGKFGSISNAPVLYYNHVIDRVEYFALLGIADACLITCVRDGMNLTSHEFIVCQQEHHSPLILSEFTGTAGSLSAAIHVNPWDYSEVAQAINEALTMSVEEKAIKHQQVYQYVTKHTANYWSKMFLEDLPKSYKKAFAYPAPYLDLGLFLQNYSRSNQRLLLFDYDGTLTAIRKIPRAAIPSFRMLKALEILSSDPRNRCCIISGRDQETLEEWLGNVAGLGLSAEHGSFLKMPGIEADSTWETTIELDVTWKNDVLQIFEYYTERTPGSFIEHKRCSLTWHYRLADPVYGSWQAKECQTHLENVVVSKLPVEILVGKKNLEVRPMSINKGVIVRRLLSAYPDADMVFCIGDDRTDEDMFKYLRNLNLPDNFCFTCTIGMKNTQAQYHISDPDDLVRIMHEMASITRTYLSSETIGA